VTWGRSWPLTLCWSLHLYRGYRRFMVGAVRTPGGRIIGLCVAVFGRMAAVTRIGPTPTGARDIWFRDWRRWSVGGWRTVRPLPLSTGWITGGPRERLGVSVTVASRTLCLFRLYTRAEWRERNTGRW
jgi:hypothetical protein